MELVATKPGSDIQTLKKYSNINKIQFIACDMNYTKYENTGWAEPLMNVFLTEVLKEGFCNNWTKTLKKLQILSLGIMLN